MTQHPITGLLDLMKALRATDNGCHWSIEQTHETLTRFTVEEVYEMIEAIEDGNVDATKDELGDLLYHIAFYCQIAEDNGWFTFDDVATHATTKMTARHPHVFADADAQSLEDIAALWQQTKAKEKAEKRDRDGLLSDISRTLPSLLRIQKMHSRAASVGFDWPTIDGPLAKVDEELQEVKDAIAEGDLVHIEEEIGDLILAAVTVASKLDIDAEQAARKSINKFERRFKAIEDGLKARGKGWADSNLDEMDEIWQDYKRKVNGAA